MTTERKRVHGALAVAAAAVLGVCAYAGGQARTVPGAKPPAGRQLGALLKASPGPASQRRGSRPAVRAADATQVRLNRIQSRATSGRAAVRGASANNGQVVTLSGSGFGEEVSVEFLGFAGSTFSLRPTKVKMKKITVSVPPEAVTGDLRLLDPAAGASNGARLQIVPTITSFTPAEIAPGARLLIDGTGYSRTTTVTFAGVKDPVPPTIVSPTRIDIVVPSGARSGKVTVRTDGGRSVAKRLVVTSPAANRRTRP